MWRLNKHTNSYTVLPTSKTSLTHFIFEYFYTFPLRNQVLFASLPTSTWEGFLVTWDQTEMSSLTVKLPGRCHIHIVNVFAFV